MTNAIIIYNIIRNDCILLNSISIINLADPSVEHLFAKEIIIIVIIIIIIVLVYSLSATVELTLNIQPTALSSSLCDHLHTIAFPCSICISMFFAIIMCWKREQKIWAELWDDKSSRIVNSHLSIILIG